MLEVTSRAVLLVLARDSQADYGRPWKGMLETFLVDRVLGPPVWIEKVIPVDKGDWRTATNVLDT